MFLFQTFAQHFDNILAFNCRLMKFIVVQSQKLSEETTT